MDITKNSTKKNTINPQSQRSYGEIVAYFDAHWKVSDQNTTLTRMKKLDKALDGVSKKTDAILIAGTNGKSLTIDFTAKLLQSEGLTVGNFIAPHILTYNERISINQKPISNKLFSELANKVIATAESLSIKANTYELLTMIALLYFEKNNVDVALLEVNEGGLNNATNICDAKVATITRATPHKADASKDDLQKITQAMMGIVKSGTWVVSGDQSKAHLLLMQQHTEKQKGNWAMPIRKLAPLAYPFEQLHGRCAALSERVAQLYINNFAHTNSKITKDSLLMKQKTQRGRPTIEAKRQAELHPKKTIEQFWKETMNTLPGRFQLLDQEKPTILLDNAHNLDAFNNLFLGIRLLHYQRPLQGLVIIIGASHDTLHNEEFLKLVRYFFKKTSGQLFVCPINGEVAGNDEEKPWDAEQVANDVKSMKIKSRAFPSFEKAFEAAKEAVHERHGLVVVTGSQSILNSYWSHKGIKKLSQ